MRYSSVVDKLLTFLLTTLYFQLAKPAEVKTEEPVTKEADSAPVADTSSTVRLLYICDYDEKKKFIYQNFYYNSVGIQPTLAQSLIIITTVITTPVITTIKESNKHLILFLIMQRSLCPLIWALLLLIKTVVETGKTIIINMYDNKFRYIVLVALYLLLSFFLIYSIVLINIIHPVPILCLCPLMVLKHLFLNPL